MLTIWFSLFFGEDAKECSKQNIHSQQVFGLLAIFRLKMTEGTRYRHPPVSYRDVSEDVTSGPFRNMNSNPVLLNAPKVTRSVNVLFTSH